MNVHGWCTVFGMIRFVDRCVIRNSMNRIRFGGIYRYAEVMVLSIQQDETARSHVPADNENARARAGEG